MPAAPHNTSEQCNTCGDTGRWESTTEDNPTELLYLGPCPDCDAPTRLHTPSEIAALLHAGNLPAARSAIIQGRTQQEAALAAVETMRPLAALYARSSKTFGSVDQMAYEAVLRCLQGERS